MYHIKDDKRTQHSAQLIVTGTNACLARQSLDDITVANILDASTVGRATFYRLFDSIIDVLAFECDQLFATMGQRKVTNLHAWLLENIRYFMAHDLLLETLVNNHQLQLFSDAQYREIQTVPELITVVPAAQRDFFLNHLTYLMVGTLATWIKHQKRESAEELWNSLSATVTLLTKIMVSKPSSL